MTGPAADLATLQDATDRLLASLDDLDDAGVAQPSRLPGWSRGHVLAHLARNADALVNVLRGRLMYPSEAARDADIERDAHRPADVHRADLRDSADRLAATAAALTDEQWRATVTLRNGVTDRATTIPFRRWVEIELHHIDLDIGRTVADLPGAFLDRALEYLTERFAGHPGVVPLELRAEDGRHWRTGRPEGEPQVITGTPAALVGWLSGRTSGSGLATGDSLPGLPAL
ncbi:maleylpyruvate isomerase family mycothiol-dependent enzyme [Streptomyces litchfieldiae]|uniref:Maleylpyruvate isomerase family mycothiol-dependent enzyme n=1 Tax=Streptomyces litchfieldiae TaxID=3075543 RepID=A0ABU2MSX8_9ACTN|nr:maleylpyruvate isomerase family mycothiol-dependent enzyme [Streptomyces sp. DSM 44938]MDT0344733.1 maleylpyruvate isomerase family mycothiol-dependent enzyme [Streptomyces sp. DSM 44938]